MSRVGAGCFLMGKTLIACILTSALNMHSPLMSHFNTLYTVISSNIILFYSTANLQLILQLILEL